MEVKLSRVVFYFYGNAAIKIRKRHVHFRILKVYKIIEKCYGTWKYNHVQPMSIGMSL